MVLLVLTLISLTHQYRGSWDIGHFASLSDKEELNHQQFQQVFPTRHNLNFLLESKFWSAIPWLHKMMYWLVGDREDKFICSRFWRLLLCDSLAFSSVYFVIHSIPFSMFKLVWTPKWPCTIWFWDSTGEVVAESMQLVMYMRWWFDRKFSLHMIASPYFRMAEMQSADRCPLTFLSAWTCSGEDVTCHACT